MQFAGERVKLGVSDSFRGRADKAAYWEAWVGAVLSRAGLFTLHQPFELDGPAREHALSWDLDVAMPSRSDSMKVWTSVEVKGINTPFTRASDYPYDSVLVCSQNSFLRKWPKTRTTGRDFLYVSTISGNVVWLPAGSQVSVGHETFDTQRRELYKTVQAKRSDLKGLRLRSARWTCLPHRLLSPYRTPS